MPLTREALRLAHGELTGQIIDSFYTVYNELGEGFVESVYTRALQIELEFRGIESERESPMKVHYRDKVVGDFRVDLLVVGTIVVEVKTADRIAKPHEKQMLNYLRASRRPVGLILNAGDRPTVKRKILT